MPEITEVGSSDSPSTKESNTKEESKKQSKVFGGLYEDKPDANLGRIAGTVKDKKQFIVDHEPWREITKVSFSDCDSKLSVYFSFPDIDKVDANKVVLWVTEISLELRVPDVNGKNYVFSAPELFGDVDPNPKNVKLKVGAEKITVKLMKTGRQWVEWERLRR